MGAFLKHDRLKYSLSFNPSIRIPHKSFQFYCEPHGEKKILEGLMANCEVKEKKRVEKNKEHINGNKFLLE